MSTTLASRPRLRPGAERSETIEDLGAPKKTQTFRPPRLAASLPEAPRTMRTSKVFRQDEYSVSGLVQLPGDAYRSDNNIYPAFFIVSGGLTEFVAFPKVTSDLAAKAVTRYRLLLWYDPREKLITYERRK